jgi:ABC-type multidrug transport system ATPase subunit
MVTTLAGEVLAIMGGSGSGKTCTLDALAFRTRPDHTRGRICLNERVCDRATVRHFVGLGWMLVCSRLILAAMWCRTTN